MGFYRIILAEKHFAKLDGHPGVRSDGTRMGNDNIRVEVDESGREAVESLLPGRVRWESLWFGPRPKPTAAQIEEAMSRLPDPSTYWTDGFVVYLPGPDGSPPSASVRVRFVRRADGTGWDFDERGSR